MNVVAGRTTDIGSILWNDVRYGRRLWQIGTADRSTREFYGGSDCRHYDNPERYAKAFPNDVTFRIGRSRAARDWNFAHWSAFSKTPHWTIEWDSQHEERGTATLTFGIASSQPVAGHLTDVRVRLNGREVGAIRLPKSGPAGYRSGCQDSLYQIVRMTFNAGLIRAGRNEITLGWAGAQPFPVGGERPRELGDLMNDAVRLEVADIPEVAAQTTHAQLQKESIS